MRDRIGRAPAVSVVVPTRQRRERLERLLRHLSAQSLDVHQFEAVVAVDGSVDGTREMLEALDVPYRLRWTWAANAGRATACNRAIRQAEGEIVVILDDDMEPSPGLLRAHLEAHPPGARRCAMGAAPMSVSPGAPAHVRYVAAKFEEHLLRLSRPDHRFVLRDFYSGNASVRRQELVDVGLFEERFRIYGNEDLELAYRLVRSGIELGYAPDAVARQHYDKSLASLAADETAKGRTAVLFAQLHPAAAPELKLAALGRQSAQRRAVRRALVLATRFVPGVADALLTLTGLAGRRSSLRPSEPYRFVLDYFYALGADREQRLSADVAP